MGCKTGFFPIVAQFVGFRWMLTIYLDNSLKRSFDWQAIMPTSQAFYAQNTGSLDIEMLKRSNGNQRCHSPVREVYSQDYAPPGVSLQHDGAVSTCSTSVAELIEEEINDSVLATKGNCNDTISRHTAVSSNASCNFIDSIELEAEVKAMRRKVVWLEGVVLKMNQAPICIKNC